LLLRSFARDVVNRLQVIPIPNINRRYPRANMPSAISSKRSRRAAFEDNDDASGEEYTITEAASSSLQNETVSSLFSPDKQPFD
jgi:hypothetical protein